MIHFYTNQIQQIAINLLQTENTKKKTRHLKFKLHQLKKATNQIKYNCGNFCCWKKPKKKIHHTKNEIKFYII